MSMVNTVAVTVSGGGSLVVSHGVTEGGVAVAPDLIWPTRSVNLSAGTVTSTQATFTNSTGASITATFYFQRTHSIQRNAADAITAYWQGADSVMSIGGAVTNGTAGSVYFGGAAGVLAQDNANFFWDDAANQLLLGLGSAANPSYSFVGDADTGLFSPGANRIQIATVGAARWECTASGNLIAVTDNTLDIGASATTRPRTIYAGTDVWAGASLRIGTGAVSSLLISISGAFTQYWSAAAATSGHQFIGTAATSGARNFVTITSPNHTGQTASTEINGFLWSAFSRQWATGAITNQREFFLGAPTYTFVGASIITNAATLYVDAPIAGTNTTITNAFAAWFGAKIRIDSAVALGGGAAATLGTIGGSGPTAAAQSEWIEVHTQNGKRFVAGWA